MATLTAREIAEHIWRPDEPLGAAVDRFRNWSKMGLIKAEGVQNPGTGRRKQYNTAALLEAVLLQTLSDTLGSSAISLTPLVKQISNMARRGAILRMGLTGPNDPDLDELLVLSGARGYTDLKLASVKRSDLGRFISKDPDVHVHIVIDIRRIFKHLPYDWMDVLSDFTERVLPAKRLKRKKQQKGKKR